MVLTFLMAFAWSAHANVDLVIGDGMLVETVWNGTENDFSTYIELSGDLTETGTGYLMGKITSGERPGSGFTAFAGLDWGNGFDNTTMVTRYTGQNFPLPGTNPPLNPGNTRPGSIPTRFYQVNTSASEQTGLNMSFAFNATREGDPGGQKVIYQEAGGELTSFQPGANSSPIPGTDVAIPTGDSWWYLGPFEAAVVYARAILESAAFDGMIPQQGLPQQNQVMNPIIRGDAFWPDKLPNDSPYRDGAHVDNLPSDDVVDWVYVALVDNCTVFSGCETVIAEKSAFIDIYGNLLSYEGTTPGVSFPGVNANNNYHVLIHHRTAPMVVSADKLLLSDYTASAPYDFTSGQDQYHEFLIGYGTKGHDILNPDGTTTQKWVILSGDGNNDGAIDPADKTILINDFNNVGYLENSDYKMDGVGDPYDNTTFLNNANKGSQALPWAN
jgi:hypothetical protein